MKKYVLFLINQQFSSRLPKHTKLIGLKILILKTSSIIDQTGTYLCNAPKVIFKNNFIIIDTLSFPDMLKKAVNSEDYEDVPYDVESLLQTYLLKKQ